MAAIQVPTETDVEQWVGLTNQIGTAVGDAASLGEGFTDVVTGINDQVADIGVLASLQTTDKTSIVAAVNEVKRLALIMGLVLGTPLN